MTTKNLTEPAPLPPITQKHIRLAYDSLGVITKDPRIREWLMRNDPMAYRQAEQAFQSLELELEPFRAEK